MNQEIIRATIEIDAANKAPGRVASEAAKVLQGKHKPGYEAHLDTGDFVVISNAAQLKFTGRKLEQKDYYHHTMYPGSLRRTPMKKVFEKDPTQVLYRAVNGMLPKNKLRSGMLKRLTINA